MNLINQIASETVLNQAYEWLCKQRQDYSPNNDVWHLRWCWLDLKPLLQSKLISGDYEFSPLDTIITDKAEKIFMWQSADALVLKAMSIVLGKHLLPVLSPNCYHITGRGGLKGAVRATTQALEPSSFVMKSDVKSYYASIDHYILYNQIKQFVDDKAVLRLVWGYLKHCVVDGGNYKNIERGISLGSSLSPLMGALYLKPLDDAMLAMGVTYIRFMDDWLIVVPSRWKLRAAVRTCNQILNALKIEQHPDKTFIGNANRGIDFLGYRFEPNQKISPSPAAIERFVAKIVQLYEQGADVNRIGQYVRRWERWVLAGLASFISKIALKQCITRSLSQIGLSLSRTIINSLLAH